MSDLSLEEEPVCPDCLKPLWLCVCAGIVRIPNRRHLVIIQHPQEQDRDLGTARLALRHFENASLRIGLSWPNLAKMVGRDVDAKRWATLYLGPTPAPGTASGQPVCILDRQGKALDPGPADAALEMLEGVILLDGSWSQAKTLWWRNAWLLKTWRIVLTPPRPSRYGKLRREPRRESVSTLEAAAQIMTLLEDQPKIAGTMISSFEAMLRKYRAGKPPAPEIAP